MGLSSASGAGQTLAHKNWEGSGLKVQPWWSRAVFCAAGSDLKRVAEEMQALERLGCDAVEVSPGGGYGAAQVMDGLMEEAGRRKMRVIVDLVAGPAGQQDLRGRIAFWAARGAAGFAVSDAAGGGLRQAAGGRLLIADGEGQLQVRRLPEEDAAARVLLAGLGAAGQGVLLEDGRARLGYARAAMLLLGGSAARILVDAILPVSSRHEARDFSAGELLLWVPKEEATPNGSVEWVRALSELHHANASLRTGLPSVLNFDAPGVLGWVVKGRDGRGAVVVICNLGEPLRVPLLEAVRGTGVRGTFLKTLLRSDGAAGGGDSLEGVPLGVDGVFVGEMP